MDCPSDNIKYNVTHFTGQCSQVGCKTIPIVDVFYQCLMYRHDCKFAAPFGASCLCTSTHRLEYSI